MTTEIGLRLKRLSPRFILIFSILFLGMVALVGFQLNAYHDQMMTERKQKTRALVESVQSLIDFYYTKASKEGMSEEDTKKYALQAIRKINNAENGYFWVLSMDGHMVMHAKNPELEGRDMTATVEKDGRILFLDMIKLAKEKQNSFMTYMWTKPGGIEGKLYPKLSYVSAFTPWNWIVGSGIYVDDVEDAFMNALYIAGAMSLALLLFCIALALTASESLRKN